MHKPCEFSSRALGGRLALLASGLTLALTVGLVGCGSEREPAEPVDSPAQAAAKRVEAQQKTETLASQFDVAAQQGGDLRPLLAEGKALVEAYPDHAPAHRLLGQIYMAGDAAQPALQHLERSLQLEPEQPEVELIAGTIAFKLEDYELAEQHYTQAVRFEPRAGRPRLHLARVYVEQQRYEQARQELLAALRLDSSLYQVHATLSDLYDRQNQLSLALDQIELALERVPPDQQAHRSLYLRHRAKLLRRANEPADALAVLRMLPERELFEAEVIEELATCWAMLGQPELAAAQYEQAIILDQTSSDFAAGAARWHLRARNLNGAERAIEHLHRLNARDARLTDLRSQLAELRSGD